MAKAKKSSKQLGLRMGLNDERIPKLFGLLLLFIAVYLTIAFVSYLFTWKIDQDRVLRFSWKLLSEDAATVDNWLGRLGAFLSNFFIYFCFGVPSFILVYFLARLGLNRLRRAALAPMANLFVKLMLLTIGMSVLLSFFFGSLTDFPIGGGVGDYLVKDLKVDWRMGAEYFEHMLIDYDVTSNWCNWNYVAGVGADPRENRYFNILSQAERYDPEGEYVKLWCPELSELPAGKIHQPDTLDDAEQSTYGLRLGANYPTPLVPSKKWQEKKGRHGSRKGRGRGRRRTA
jgi:hypothetical protein